MEEEISFGHFLKTRRKTLDLTQETLAQQVGCAVITIRKFESEARRPSQQMAARLADVLRLSDEERDEFIQLARQEIQSNSEGAEVFDIAEEQPTNAEDPVSVLTSASSSGAFDISTSESNITFTIPKSRFIWIIIAGVGVTLVLSLIVWHYGLFGTTKIISERFQDNSETHGRDIFMPMILNGSQVGLGTKDVPMQPSSEGYNQFSVYPEPVPSKDNQQLAYPGPAHPDALLDAQATPGGFVNTQIVTKQFDTVGEVTFSPDGRFFASAGNTDISIWQVEDGKFLGTFGPHGGYISSISFSPDGTTIASGSQDSTIKLWQVSNGHMLRNDSAHEGAWIRQVLFSPDGELLASVSRPDPTFDDWAIEQSTKVTLWRSEDGRWLKWLETPPQLEEPFSELQLHRPNTITYITFSPDGTLLAAKLRNDTIAVWRIVDGVLLYIIDAEESSINSLAFSPDGQMLVAGGMVIKMWDVQSGEPRKTIQTSIVPAIGEIAFNYDGSVFASVSDSKIHLWRFEDGTLLTTLEAHRWGILSLAFSPVENILISSSGDRTIRIWDLQELLAQE